MDNSPIICVLEQEESIWRRKDGRLVRYYPLTNNSTAVEDDALPVPILAPDPLSLQGKILVLLDHDSQMGDFPTMNSQSALTNRNNSSLTTSVPWRNTASSKDAVWVCATATNSPRRRCSFLRLSEAYLQNEMNL